jgi:hypothetical protein
MASLNKFVDPSLAPSVLRNVIFVSLCSDLNSSKSALYAASCGLARIATIIPISVG